MTVYSVGYGNRTYQDFIDLVHRHGLTHIVDVRSVPYSNYQAEFRRERLIDLVPASGLRYVFMGDTLGGATVRGAAEDASCREALNLGLERLAKAASDPAKRLALMCGCLVADNCHRGVLLGQELSAKGLEYVHIGRAGELVSHADLLERLVEPQGALF